MTERPQQFELWLADLNPERGTEPGKIRPVIIIQSNLLNAVHPSTIICPLTSNLSPTNLLRVRIPARAGGLVEDSEILVDQIRSIDNRRLIKPIDQLEVEKQEELKQKLLDVLDLF